MKILYKKDYTSLEPAESNASIEMNTAIVDSGEPSLMEIYELYKRKTPKNVAPKEKANYDYLLKRCDGLAQIYKGKIYGLVDSESYVAKIHLALPKFIEFTIQTTCC